MDIPITLEQGLSDLSTLWNEILTFPEGARVLHKLLGTNIGVKSGGLSVATTMAGIARPIGPDELAQIPGIIAAVRAEEAVLQEHADQAAAAEAQA